jgi:uncharacterized protein DUF4178
VADRPCPSCGAPVQFRSAAPYAVCPYCQSLLVRRDATLESIGRVAEVPEDFSPLQLNVSGLFDGKRFTLIGRQRKAWDQGSWSEWCALFDDQRLGWLAEAQGDLVMTFERDPKTLTPTLTADWVERVKPAMSFKIEQRPFTVTDVKSVVCLGAEGELLSSPPPPKGTSMTSIDVRGPGFEFGTIEASDEGISVFTGRFVEFDECRFSNLRALDGWRPPVAAPR